jgi:GNAT superfamily N-acetyltransferase
MIRKATEADIPRLAEIVVYGWRTAYRGIVPDDVLFNQRTVAKAMERFKNNLESPDIVIDVWDDGIIKGFATHHIADDEDLSNAYDLIALYIEPQFKGQGFGSTLLKSVEDQAKDKGFKTLVIWTLEENSNSIRFYENHGYTKDGKKKHMDAWDADIIRLKREIGDSENER